MIRPKLLTVRLSEAEHAILAVEAKALAVSLSACLRTRAFSSAGTVPTQPCTPTVGRLTRQVTSRLTAEEAEQLAGWAKDSNLSVAAYVRGLLRATPPPPARSDARAAVVALGRVGNNLNQLTRLAHGGRVLSTDLFQAVESLRVEVYRLREEILAQQERRS